MKPQSLYKSGLLLDFCSLVGFTSDWTGPVQSAQHWEQRWTVGGTYTQTCNGMHGDPTARTPAHPQKICNIDFYKSGRITSIHLNTWRKGIKMLCSPAYLVTLHTTQSIKLHPFHPHQDSEEGLSRQSLLCKISVLALHPHQTLVLTFANKM